MMLRFWIWMLGPVRVRRIIEVFKDDHVPVKAKWIIEE